MMNNQSGKVLIEWKHINERTVSTKIYSKYEKVTLNQCYEPTNETDVGTKTGFYEELGSVFEREHAHEIVLVNGDFNAKMEIDNTGLESHG